MTRLNVHLYRDSFNTPWGFRLQGGKDLNQPLTVQRVFSNSPAEGELQRGDNILSINGRETSSLTHKQAQDYIKHGGGQIQLVILRPPPGTFVAPLSPPIVTPRPRAPSLQSPSYYSPHASPGQYNQSPSYNTMNGDPYHGYRPQHSTGQTTYKSKPTYLQIQVDSPSNQKHIQPPQYHQHHKKPQQQYKQHQPHRHHSQQQHPHHQHQNYYLQQQQQHQQEQPARYRSSYSQPPVTPTTPTPPWASQQAAPKRVTKLSNLGGGGKTFGTDYASLPRSFSAQHGPQVHRPRPEQFTQDEEREPDLPLATGPVPKVCSRRNLGGGSQTFGTSFGRSATLPRRHEAGRRSSQPPSMPSAGYYGYSAPKAPVTRYGGPPQFGTDYSAKTPAQRVQTTLDNIMLSPKTPEAPSSNFQPYSPPQNQQAQLSPQYRPQQVYTPTSLLLEQQRLQEQQQPQEEGEESIPPVWERRRMFQQGNPSSGPSGSQGKPVRTPLSQPKPRVPKPQPFSPANKYASFGQDYSNRGPQQNNAVWRPSQPTPKAQPFSPGLDGPALVQSTPPPWKRPEDDVDDSRPAWRSTLKSASGVKPWERDVEYQQQHPSDEPDYGSAPSHAQAPYSSGPLSPGSGPETPGRKVVHLQYNSPMNLYSAENVAETYDTHNKALLSPGGTDRSPAKLNQAGGRDWSQSAVLQLLNKENKRSGGGGPRVAPKPSQAVVHLSPAPPQQQQQHQQRHHYQQPYYDDALGTSDF